MDSVHEKFDDAMYEFSTGDYEGAIVKLRALLAEDPAHFDAQLALGMAYCRKGDFAAAIAEGHKAEAMRPLEQLVHTNLSLFYMKAGDKTRAEHHGAQARIAAWKADDAAARAKASPPSGANRTSAGAPPQFPEMPWKKPRNS